MDAAANDPVPNDADQDYYDEDSYDGDSYGTDSYDTAAPDSDYHPPAPRYRPGRGGYDAEAAEVAAAARYVFRQRLVLGLALLAVATGLAAGGLALTNGWYVHAAVDLCLLGYLAYLRRQVRLEQSIRARRAARMAGSRYSGTAGSALGSPLLEDPLGDEPEWDEVRPERRRGTDRPSRRGRSRRRPTVGEEVAARAASRRRGEADARYANVDYDSDSDGDSDADYDADADYDDADYDETDYDETADREVAGAVGQDDFTDQVPALPRLRPTAPPERPRGTVVLELDDEDPELHELDSQLLRGYRRASGQ
ncbi:MAG: hypothetical protein QOI50_5618 [Pseudonocardiales bacterium]|nr:hypothetical protein [Pseudonocardiales bacterium]